MKVKVSDPRGLDGKMCSSMKFVCETRGLDANNVFIYVFEG